MRRIDDGDGPPLCAMSEFEYQGGRCVMRPGELLCVITDGVSEAQDPAGALFGGARVEAMLARMGSGAATARSVVEALQADVGVFVAGAEPADDLTILALRWQGPGTGAPTSWRALAALALRAAGGTERGKPAPTTGDARVSER